MSKPDENKQEDFTENMAKARRHMLATNLLRAGVMPSQLSGVIAEIENSLWLAVTIRAAENAALDGEDVGLLTERDDLVTQLAGSSAHAVPSDDLRVGIEAQAVESIRRIFGWQVLMRETPHHTTEWVDATLGAIARAVLLTDATGQEYISSSTTAAVEVGLTQAVSDGGLEPVFEDTEVSSG